MKGVNCVYWEDKSHDIYVDGNSMHQVVNNPDVTLKLDCDLSLYLACKNPFKTIIISHHYNLQGTKYNQHKTYSIDNILYNYSRLCIIFTTYIGKIDHLTTYTE